MKTIGLSAARAIRPDATIGSYVAVKSPDFNTLKANTTDEIMRLEFHHDYFLVVSDAKEFLK